MAVQWFTTMPSGKAHTCEADDGQTGWRLHAVDGAEDWMSFEDIKGKRAVCGLKPRHGWSLDLFIEEKCRRCLRAINRDVDAVKEVVSRRGEAGLVTSEHARIADKIGKGQSL